ncbi:cytochrome b561 [Sodalis ligni]|uniref:cytochrome b561 n=1 Tax=Sodalis ligni TaxID=2697027 RepID=UPI00193F4AD2|nr:cytochrome b561 [Sodalis ligni]QWA13695.1 cytochrome b561 [Sodalis ligni]
MGKKYSSLQMGFHWIIFILIATAYAAMELRGFAPYDSALRKGITTLHYTAGVSVLILMVLRILVRLAAQTPAIVPQPPRWQMILAHLVHGVMYLMFVCLPLLGLLTLYFGGREWVFFGYAMPVRDIPDADMQSRLRDIHELIANTGYFIIGLHAAAALFHHYIMRDNTLERMLPGKPR